jgi:Flp pilus assembly CpaE family ATPase
MVIRAVTAALDTYEKLDYPKEKIKFVLNAIFPSSNLSKDKLEAALGMNVFVTIPYTRDVFVEAINLGQPLSLTDPTCLTTHEVWPLLCEDFATSMQDP